MLEAERKMADQLDVAPFQIRDAAHRLWGRTLTDEREARLARRIENGDVSPRSLQAHRGHVTRELEQEIEQALREKDNG